jgi:hypothetical protein
VLEFIPRPEQDELLYSMVARGVEMAGRSAAPQMLAACTGSASGMVGVDLPCGIDRLLAALPDGGVVDGGGGRYVDCHTMYPYMLRFGEPLTRARVHAAMLHKAARRPAKLGLMAWAFPSPPCLRACTACIRADTAQVGMPWWRRVHQLPGVYVCPIHGMPLSRTTVPRLGMRGARGLIALDSTLVCKPDVHPRSTARRAMFVSYAAASARLLDPDCSLQADPATLGGRLRELLVDFRWRRAPSLLDVAGLTRAFMSHPGIRPMLRAMQVEMTDEQLGTALNRLLYGHGTASHPLLVLIILQLTGDRLQDLEVVPDRRPAPSAVQARCEQPMCRVTGPIRVTPSPAARRPMATSGCALEGSPDVGCNNGLSPAGSPGSTEWDRSLIDLLSGGASVRAAARELGVAPVSVQRHARRLDVWRSKWVDRPKLQLRAADRPRVLLERHRAAWLLYRQSAHRTIKDLPRHAFNAYRYLMTHDRLWLTDNLPLCRPAVQARVDWAARDKEMCGKARALIACGIGSGGLGVLSPSSVGRALGAYSVVMANKERLPGLYELIRESRQSAAEVGTGSIISGGLRG